MVFFNEPMSPIGLSNISNYVIHTRPRHPKSTEPTHENIRVISVVQVSDTSVIVRTTKLPIWEAGFIIIVSDVFDLAGNLINANRCFAIFK